MPQSLHPLIITCTAVIATLQAVIQFPILQKGWTSKVLEAIAVHGSQCGHVSSICCMQQVRRWDSETGANVDTFNGSKAVYCVAPAPSDGALVAFGGAERALHVWDLRTPAVQETVRCAVPDGLIR